MAAKKGERQPLASSVVYQRSPWLEQEYPDLLWEISLDEYDCPMCHGKEFKMVSCIVTNVVDQNLRLAKFSYGQYHGSCRKLGVKCLKCGHVTHSITDVARKRK